jgi:hypothetical protein
MENQQNNTSTAHPIFTDYLPVYNNIGELHSNLLNYDYYSNKPGLPLPKVDYSSINVPDDEFTYKAPRTGSMYDISDNTMDNVFAKLKAQDPDFGRGLQFSAAGSKNNIGDASRYLDGSSDQGYKVGRDNEEINASTQSGWADLLLRMPITAGEKTASVALSTVASIAYGFNQDNPVSKFFNGIYDNRVNRSFESKDYQNAGALSKYGYSTHWANQVSDMVGFSLGSIAPAAIFGPEGFTGGLLGASEGEGAGLLSSIGKKVGGAIWDSKLETLGANALEGNGTLLSQELSGFGRNLASNKNWTKGLNFLETDLTASASEAAFEADDTKKRTYNKMVADGMNPLDAADIAENVKAKTFAWNMPVLMASNLFEIPALLKTHRGVIEAADRIFMNEEGQVAVNALGIKGYAKEVGKTAIKGAFAEGLFEENFQQAIQNSADHITDAYIQANKPAGFVKDKDNFFNVDPKKNIDNTSIFSQLGSILKDAAYTNFITPEGQDNIVGGIMMGVFMGGHGAYRSAKQDQKHAEQIVKNFNSQDVKSLAEVSEAVKFLANTIKEPGKFIKDEEGNDILDKNGAPIPASSKLIRNIQTQGINGLLANQLANAAFAGDKEAYKAIQDLMLTNFVYNHLSNGLAKILDKKLEYTDGMSEDEKKALNIDSKEDLTGKDLSFEERKNQLKEKIEHLKNVYSKVEGIYGNDVIHTNEYTDENGNKIKAGYGYNIRGIFNTVAAQEVFKNNHTEISNNIANLEEEYANKYDDLIDLESGLHGDNKTNQDNEFLNTKEKATNYLKEHGTQKENQEYNLLNKKKEILGKNIIVLNNHYKNITDKETNIKEIKKDIEIQEKAKQAKKDKEEKEQEDAKKSEEINQKLESLDKPTFNKINDLVERISKGEKIESPEDLQLQQNHSDIIENLLDKKKKEEESNNTKSELDNLAKELEQKELETKFEELKNSEKNPTKFGNLATKLLLDHIDSLKQKYSSTKDEINKFTDLLRKKFNQLISEHKSSLSNKTENKQPITKPTPKGNVKAKKEGQVKKVDNKQTPSTLLKTTTSDIVTSNGKYSDSFLLDDGGNLIVSTDKTLSNNKGLFINGFTNDGSPTGSKQAYQRLLFKNNLKNILAKKGETSLEQAGIFGKLMNDSMDFEQDATATEDNIKKGKIIAIVNEKGEHLDANGEVTTNLKNAITFNFTHPETKETNDLINRILSTRENITKEDLKKELANLKELRSQESKIGTMFVLNSTEGFNAISIIPKEVSLEKDDEYIYGEDGKISIKKSNGDVIPVKVNFNEKLADFVQELFNKANETKDDVERSNLLTLVEYLISTSDKYETPVKIHDEKRTFGLIAGKTFYVDNIKDLLLNGFTDSVGNTHPLIFKADKKANDADSLIKEYSNNEYKSYEDILNSLTKSAVELFPDGHPLSGTPVKTNIYFTLEEKPNVGGISDVKQKATEAYYDEDQFNALLDRDHQEAIDKGIIGEEIVGGEPNITISESSTVAIIQTQEKSKKIDLNALREQATKVSESITGSITKPNASEEKARKSTLIDSVPAREITIEEWDWFYKVFNQSFNNTEFNRKVHEMKEASRYGIYATWSKAGIALYRASQHELYHEAWHEFSQLYLTKEQKQALYNEVRKKVASLKDAKDYDVEEHIAEDFKEYVLSKGTKILDKTPVKKSIFEKIWNFIKEMFSGKVDLDTYYERLYKGKLNRLGIRGLKYVPKYTNIDYHVLHRGEITSVGGVRQSKTNMELFTIRESIQLTNSIDRIIYKAFYNDGANVVDALQESVKNSFHILEHVKKILANQLITKIDQLESYKDTKDYDDLYDAYLPEIQLLQKSIDNFNDVKTYWAQNTKSYTVIGEEILDNLVEDFDRVGQAFENKNSNEVSTLESSSKETRALIRGLAKTDGNGKTLYNDFGLEESVDFFKTWNNLALLNANLSGYTKIYSKIGNNVDAHPEYVELLTRLPHPSEIVNSSNTELALVSKFEQDFSKALVPINKVLADRSGDQIIYKLVESSKNNFNSVKDIFENNFNTVDSNHKNKDEFGNYTLNKSILDMDISTLKSSLEFLKVLGFEFSEETKESPNFEKNILSIVKRLKGSNKKGKESGLNLLFDKIPDGINNPLRQLSEAFRDGKVKESIKMERRSVNDLINLESKYNIVNPTASMLNAKGDLKHSITLYNTASLKCALLNEEIWDNVTLENRPRHLDELIAEDPFMNFLKDSGMKYTIWYNQLFDVNGKRIKINNEYVKLEMSDLSGMDIEDEANSETTTSLYISDKAAMDINILLKDGQAIKDLSRMSDKTSDLSISLSDYGTKSYSEKLPVPLNSILDERAKTHMYRYLSYELDRIAKMKDKNSIYSNIEEINKNGKNFTIFTDIFNDKLKKHILDLLETNGNNVQKTIDDLSNNKDVNTSIVAFFNSLQNKICTYLANSEIGLVEKFGNEFKPLNAEQWLDKELYDVKANEATKKNQFHKLTRAYAMNSFIMNVEAGLFFFGDAGYYKAFYKRNAKESSTGTILSTDVNILNKLNKDREIFRQMSKEGGVNLIMSSEIGQKLDSVVLNDVVVGTIAEYQENWKKELLNQGIEESIVNKIVDAYNSDINEADAQGMITMDFYRSYKMLQGKWWEEHETAFKKIISGKELTKEDMFLFMPIKAQVSGHKAIDNTNIPIFHKFSLYPLLPSVINGTNLEHLNRAMIDQNISYGLFRSGSKVGTTLNSEGTSDNLYSGDISDRNFNHIDYTKNPVWLRDIKEQVNIDPEIHDSMLIGTQMRKLFAINNYNNGSPINKDIAQLHDEAIDIMANIVKIQKEDLLDELGISEENGEYQAKDFDKLVTKFLKEAQRRDLSDNIKQFIKYNPDTKRFVYDLDASANRGAIQSMIMGLLDNKLRKLVTNGDFMVQAASTGFEKSGINLESDVLKYGSNGLQFYHINDKTGEIEPITVKIPMSGQYKNLLNREDVKNLSNEEHISTLEALNKLISQDEWLKDNKSLITMLGYRIPTQALNSIEHIRVAQFLDESAGDIIIVPTEITKKAGSDFDIDKLAIIKANIDKNGNIINFDKSLTKEFFIDKIKDLKLQRSGNYSTEKNKINDLYTQYKEGKDYKKQDLKFLFTQKLILRAELNEVFDSLKDSDFSYNDLQQNEFGKITKSLLDIFDKVLSNTNDDLEYEKIQRLQQLSILNSKINDLLNLDLKKDLDEGIHNIKEKSLNKMFILEEELNQMYINKNGIKANLQNQFLNKVTSILKDASSLKFLLDVNDDSLISEPIAEISKHYYKELQADPKNTSIYYPTTEWDKFQSLLSAKKALGIAALGNTFWQLYAKYSMTVNSNMSKIFKSRQLETTSWGSQEQVIKDSNIPVETHLYLLEGSKINQNNFSGLYDESGVYRSKTAEQLINVLVDAANKDFSIRGNLTIDNISPVLYMAFRGVSMDHILQFINQPIIRKYSQMQSAKKGLLGSDDSTILEEIYKLIPDYVVYSKSGKISKGKTNDKIMENVSSEIFSMKSLKKGIAEVDRKVELKNINSKVLSNMSIDELLKNAQLLIHFMNIQEQSGAMSDLQQYLNFDTSKIASPVEASMKLIQQKTNIKNTGLFNQEAVDKIQNDSIIAPFNNNKLILDVNQQIFPITSDKLFISSLGEFLDGQMVKKESHEKVAKTYTNDFLEYLFQNYAQYKGENVYNKFLGVQGDNAFFGKNTMVDRLSGLSKTKEWIDTKEKFELLGLIRPQITVIKNNKGVESAVKNIKILTIDKSAEFQNNMIQQWETIVNNASPEIKEFFEDLAMFSMLQSGHNVSQISFTNLVPNSLYTNIMQDAINKFKVLPEESKKKLYKDFTNQFEKNNATLLNSVTPVSKIKGVPVYSEKVPGLKSWMLKLYKSSLIGEKALKSDENLVNYNNESRTNREATLSGLIESNSESIKFGTIQKSNNNIEYKQVGFNTFTKDRVRMWTNNDLLSNFGSNNGKISDGELQYNKGGINQSTVQHLLYISLQEVVGTNSTWRQFDGVFNRLREVSGIKSEIFITEDNGKQEIPFYQLDNKIIIGLKQLENFIKGEQKDNVSYKNVLDKVKITINEELIHLIAHNLTSKEDIDKIFNELSDNDKLLIKTLYGQEDLSKDQLVHEFLRMKVQQELLNTTSEEVKAKSDLQTKNKEALKNWFNKIIEFVSSYLPKLSTTTSKQIVNNIINFTKNELGEDISQMIESNRKNQEQPIVEESNKNIDSIVKELGIDPLTKCNQ